MSLRARVAATTAAGVALVVLVTAVVVYVAVRSELRGEVDVSLEARLQPFLAAGDGDGDRGGGPRGRQSRPTRAVASPFGADAGLVQILSPTGQISSPGDEPATTVVPVGAAALAIARTGSGTARADATVAGTHLRILTIGRGRGDGAAQAIRSLEEVDGSLRRLLVTLALLGAGGMLVAALSGGLVARSALAPIVRFARRAEELTGAPDLSARLDGAGRHEIGRLARSFNATLDSLERSLHAQRQLVADAGHELRTPITSLRVNLQVLDEADSLSEAELGALRADIVEELDELTALVADVVELARGGVPDEQRDDVRLDRLVGSAVERARRRSPALEVTLAAEPTLVSGDAERIARAVTNVLDNARAWSPEAGTIEVSVSGATVRVRDHGPGFAAADAERIFDRFYRADEARGRPGAGLGLAIVRQTAEAHGGWARAENHPDGGACLLVCFGTAAAAGA